MIIALARLAPRTAQLCEARAAVVTLVPVHPSLARAHARTIAYLAPGSIEVTPTSLAAAGSI